MLKSKTSIGVALASLALVVLAAPVGAHDGTGDDDNHRGKVGRHAFTDSEFRPGARCAYRMVTSDAEASVAAAGYELAGVSVRPPKVAAIDKGRRVDRQPVAWRFVLQEKVGDGDWTAVKRSRVQVRKASDRRAADFSRLKVRYDGHPDADYRVKTKAFWLKKRNPLKRIGVATHVVDYYKVRGETMEGSCPGGIPAVEAP
jgi:hypothetical protein